MLKEILYPQTCLSCKSTSDIFICQACLEKNLKFTPQETKYNCTYLEEVLYFEEFAGLNRQIIKLGKYKFNVKVWTILAKKINEKISLKQESVLTFVPMTWSRYCYRGFNQAKILASKIAKEQKLPIVKLLKRTRFSGSLTKLNRESRSQEIKNVFEINKSQKLLSKKVKVCYLVDDVYTSGATLNAAAKAIRSKYPNLKIIGLCFAKTPKYYKDA